MRDYGIISPKFWIGSTGKALRGDPLAQLVALYLMTSPHATMIGVYSCPVVYIAHEVGCPIEGASKALARLIDGGFCSYDESTETVFVHRMVVWQVGDALKTGDKRLPAVRREWQNIGPDSLKRAFHAIYAKAFQLPKLEPLASPSEAPCKPLRSQDQDQDQDQEQEQTQSASVPARPPAILNQPAPASRPVAVAPAMSGQQSGSEDAEQAEDAERRPATGPRTLFDCLDVGSEGSSVESPAKGPKRGKADGAKKSPKAATRAAVLRDRAADIATVLELWREQPYHGRSPVITTARQTRVADRLLEGGTVEELCEAVQGVALSAYHLGANDSATKYVDIGTILRDRGQVEKFADLFRNGASRAAAAPTSYRAGIQPMAPVGEECWTPGDGKNWLEDDNA